MRSAQNPRRTFDQKFSALHADDMEADGCGGLALLVIVGGEE
jgi:hypothetical protein